nr:hypothetical protein Iba_chr12aCG9720 [Ipomoea batatas]GMD63487.1 hypothetical protein Iba_chr12bCG15330 [Ipomoea batatas]GMD66251.1 hypothetical protein Iba_chr12cCG13220 [Ipomoea batatas]GMD68335.1 hypothetical protein Iba_chr12dCG8190 [Ipomoea batatas]GMD70614.1 hypothetical protein Iba_chr12eCG8040 [Ipomoea batatas]
MAACQLDPISILLARSMVPLMMRTAMPVILVTSQLEKMELLLSPSLISRFLLLEHILSLEEL